MKAKKTHITYVDFLEKLRVLVNDTTIHNFSKRLENILNKVDFLLRNGVEFYAKPNKDKGLKGFKEVIQYKDVCQEYENNASLVKKVINEYMRGDLYLSISLLNDWWGSVKERVTFTYAPLKEDYVYYRVRHKNSQIFQHRDMFHIPLNLRGQVTTQRYSMPGYPCLYLGKSIYACWEELKRPALDDFAVSAFKARKKFYLLDLRLRKRFYTKENCLQFLKMLPIVLACSMRVKNEDDNFKPEYILPQLLLHIVIVQHQGDGLIDISPEEKIKIEGIVYSSVAVNDEFNFANSPTTYYIGDCVVLPVKVIDGSSQNLYCQDLISKFLVSNPKYYESDYIKDSFAFMRHYLCQLIKLEDGNNARPPFAKNYDSSYFKYLEMSWKETDFKQI